MGQNSGNCFDKIYGIFVQSANIYKTENDKVFLKQHFQFLCINRQDGIFIHIVQMIVKKNIIDNIVIII